VFVPFLFATREAPRQMLDVRVRPWMLSIEVRFTSRSTGFHILCREFARVERDLIRREAD